MNQTNLFYKVALVLSSMLLFHCAIGKNLDDSSSNNMKRNPNVNINPTDLANLHKQSGARAQELLSRKNQNFPWTNSNKKQNNFVGTDEETKMCEDTNSRCLDLRDSIESHFTAVEANIDIVTKINRNLVNLLVTLQSWKDSCGENQQYNSNKDTTIDEESSTLKPSQSRRAKNKKKGTISTTPSTTLIIDNNLDPESSDDISSEETTTIVSRRKSTENVTTKKNIISVPTDTSDKSSDDSTITDSKPTYPFFVGKENTTAEIECDSTKKHVITIIDAFYGVPDMSTCVPTKYESTLIKTGDRTAFVRSMCGMSVQSRCSFQIASSLLGDSCPGQIKNLRISYYCSLRGLLAMHGNSEN